MGLNSVSGGDGVNGGNGVKGGGGGNGESNREDMRWEGMSGRNGVSIGNSVVVGMV